MFIFDASIDQPLSAIEDDNVSSQRAGDMQTSQMFWSTALKPGEVLVALTGIFSMVLGTFAVPHPEIQWNSTKTVHSLVVWGIPMVLPVGMCFPIAVGCSHLGPIERPVFRALGRLCGLSCFLWDYGQVCASLSVFHDLHPIFDSFRGPKLHEPAVGDLEEIFYTTFGSILVCKIPRVVSVCRQLARLSLVVTLGTGELCSCSRVLFGLWTLSTAASTDNGRTRRKWINRWQGYWWFRKCKELRTSWSTRQPVFNCFQSGKVKPDACCQKMPCTLGLEEDVDVILGCSVESSKWAETFAFKDRWEWSSNFN